MFLTSTAMAVSAPIYRSINEYRAILESPALVEKLGVGSEIVSIEIERQTNSASSYFSVTAYQSGLTDKAPCTLTGTLTRVISRNRAGNPKIRLQFGQAVCAANSIGH